MGIKYERIHSICKKIMQMLKGVKGNISLDAYE